MTETHDQPWQIKKEFYEVATLSLWTQLQEKRRKNTSSKFSTMRSLADGIRTQNAQRGHPLQRMQLLNRDDVMDLPELCEKLTRASHLDATKKAIVILWLKSQEKDRSAMPIRDITKIFCEHRLGNPNRGVLSKGLSSSPLTLKTASGFVLRAGAGETVSAWLAHVMGNAVPSVNQAQGYLPEAVWLKTRDYVERVCTQVNGCYYYGFYDATAVMVR